MVVGQLLRPVIASVSSEGRCGDFDFTFRLRRWPDTEHWRTITELIPLRQPPSWDGMVPAVLREHLEPVLYWNGSLNIEWGVVCQITGLGRGLPAITAERAGEPLATGRTIAAKHQCG